MLSPLTQAKGSVLEAGPGRQTPVLDIRALCASDLWIAAAQVALIEDTDHDGFFQSLQLTFDPDVQANPTPAFAEVFMTTPEGFQNRLHVTPVFYIHPHNLSDAISVTVALRDGIPEAHYDLLIVLTDLDHGCTVAFEPETFALVFLPLEDSERDGRLDGDGITIVFGGGSLGSILLLALGSLLLIKGRQLFRIRTDAKAG